jgi:hypothetical protein
MTLQTLEKLATLTEEMQLPESQQHYENLYELRKVTLDPRINTQVSCP